jgi:hypothetical protein
MKKEEKRPRNKRYKISSSRRVWTRRRIRCRKGKSTGWRMITWKTRKKKEDAMENEKEKD